MTHKKLFYLKNTILFKSFICIILPAFFFVALWPVYAAGAEGIRVEGTFLTLGRVVSWEYDYRDDYFLKPSDQYNHDLARLSFGMAASAFRNREHPDTQEDYLAAFLQEMGFSQIEAESYHTEPTADSVSQGIAHKKIGDRTVLACAVCGGNYGEEWASNLTVGNSDRPLGFQQSSVKVQAAIADYMDRNLQGDRNVTLWITGFSRGAAIANITAAECIESGMFLDVYAYTFATPRTTKTPVSYPNIFNIIQKEDPVPKIPLEDWGYKRFGRDLFFVSPETDSGSSGITARAGELYRKMLGSEMVINSEINYQLRILLDYLYMLMPDPAVYTQYLQPLVIEIMTDGEGKKDAIKVLLKALRQYRTDDPDAKKELRAMREYLNTLVDVYYIEGGLKSLPPDRWDPSFGTANLFNGHFAFEYLAMLYASDDPEELFSDYMEYVRIIVYGNTDISISDGNDVIKEILSDGTELVNGVEDPYSFPDAEWSEGKVMITLPADQSYEITIRSMSDLPQTISYTGILFSGHTVRAKMDNLYSYLMNKGETAVIRTCAGTGAIEPDSSDHTDISFFTDTIYSPTTAMRIENNSVDRFTIAGWGNRVLLILLLLVLQLIASVILLIVRRKGKKRKYIRISYFWHAANVVLFSLLSAALWCFAPEKQLTKVTAEILVCIVIVVYALKGCLQENGNWKLFWILTAMLAGFLVLENLLLGEYAAWKSILVIIIYLGFLTAAFLMNYKFLQWRTNERHKTVI